MHPDSTPGGQRLGVEDVERRPGKMASVERRQQRLVDDVAAARHVDEEGQHGVVAGRVARAAVLKEEPAQRVERLVVVVRRVEVGSRRPVSWTP